VQAVAVAPRGLQALLAAGALTFALFGTAVVVASSWPAEQARPVTASFLLDSIPNGMTEVSVEGLPVFLHRTGSEIVAISPIAQGGDPVIWCPAENLFVSYLHRSTFRPWGERVGGPSLADLPTYPVRLQWNEAIVDATRAFGGGRARLGTSEWSEAERRYVCAFV
jgi:hypothetical protein